MKKSPLNFIGSIAGLTGSISGNNNSAASSAASRAAIQSAIGSMTGNQSIIGGIGQVANQLGGGNTPVNPGFNTDPNNLTQQSGSIVSFSIF